MASVSIPHVSPESRSTTSRSTLDGRRLTYQLSVIQQPERARACGQGAKSSTDRRPVDPPPIIELRIFEGEDTSRTDITFSHRANFFLYASLESARTASNGRSVPPSSTAPVLTGMSVSGMAYLDRPQSAGYFIYSDLSVRHEGTYRLAFTLFEELKEARDADPEQTQTAPNREHFTCRSSVRTLPFTVYSAKKFPGLAESTALSRTVADQGCRVRIRRDVRMRRRETKGGKDFDDFDDEGLGDEHRDETKPTGASGHGPHQQIPVEAPDAKSADNSHPQSSHSHSLQPIRPPSPQQDMGNPFYYQQSYSQPSQTNYQQQYGPGSIGTYQQPPYMPQQQLYTSPTSINPYSQNQPPLPGGMNASFDRSSDFAGQRSYMSNWDYSYQGQQRYDSYAGAYVGQMNQYDQQQSYGQSGSSASLVQMDSGYSRQGQAAAPPPQPSQQQQTSYVNNSHQRQSSMSASTVATNTTEAQQARRNSAFATAPAGVTPHTSQQSSQAYSIPAPPPPSQYLTATPSQRAPKRTYDSAFVGNTHTEGSFRHGQRPSTSASAAATGTGVGGYGAADIGSISQAQYANGFNNAPALVSPTGDFPDGTGSSSDEEFAELEEFKMVYRRADGTEISRGFAPGAGWIA